MMDNIQKRRVHDIVKSAVVGVSSSYTANDIKEIGEHLVTLLENENMDSIEELSDKTLWDLKLWLKEQRFDETDIKKIANEIRRFLKVYEIEKEKAKRYGPDAQIISLPEFKKK